MPFLFYALVLCLIAVGRAANLMKIGEKTPDIITVATLLYALICLPKFFHAFINKLNKRLKCAKLLYFVVLIIILVITSFIFNVFNLNIPQNVDEAISIFSVAILIIEVSKNNDHYTEPQGNSNKLVRVLGLLLLALFLIIGVPVIINELYKLDCGYVTKWDAGTVLSYYGAVLAAIGAAIGVYWSIQQSQKQYREDARQRIMPFIATDFLIDSSCYNDFVENNTDTTITDQSGYDHFMITYSKEKGIQYPIYLSEEKATLLERRGHYDIIDKETGATITGFKLVRFFPLVIKNVGVAVALKTTFGLYKLKDGEYTEIIDERKTSTPMILDKGEKKYIGLFFDLDDEEALGVYKFDLMYSDTNYTRYRRSITIEFSKNPKTRQIEYRRVDTGEHEIYSMKENGRVKEL